MDTGDREKLVHAFERADAALRSKLSGSQKDTPKEKERYEALLREQKVLRDTKYLLASNGTLEDVNLLPFIASEELRALFHNRGIVTLKQLLVLSLVDIKKALCNDRHKHIPFVLEQLYAAYHSKQEEIPRRVNSIFGLGA